MKQVRYHVEALAELEATALYYEQQQPGLGFDFLIEWKLMLSLLVLPSLLNAGNAPRMELGA